MTGRTAGLSFNTRETVAMLTPADLATSRIVAGDTIPLSIPKNHENLVAANVTGYILADYGGQIKYLSEIGP